MNLELKKNKIHVGILFNDIKPYKEYKELLFNKFNFNGIAEVILYSADFKPFENGTNVIQANDILKKIHIFFHHTLIWRNQAQTLSYKFRAISLFGTNKQREKIDNNLGCFPKSPRIWSERYLVRLFSKNPLIFLLSKILTYVVFPIMAIKNRRCLDKLDFVLLPYGARLSIEEDFLIWFAKQKQVKTIAIQENWDNLSSKKFIFSKPDFFITWGAQSSAHLRQIHKYRGAIKELGCIRMQQFYTYRNSLEENRETVTNHKFNCNSTDDLILFIGTGRSTDYELLGALTQFLKEHTELSNNKYFVFRPHPLSRNNLRKDYSIFSHEKIKIEFPKENESNFYRIELIKQASLVIGFYSTVLLESLIMGKIVAIPNFIGVQNYYKSGNYLNDSAHFSGIKDLKNLYSLDSINHFKTILQSLPIEVEDSESGKILNEICIDKSTDLEITNFLHTISATRTMHKK